MNPAISRSQRITAWFPATFVPRNTVFSWVIGSLAMQACLALAAYPIALADEPAVSAPLEAEVPIEAATIMEAAAIIVVQQVNVPNAKAAEPKHPVVSHFPDKALEEVVQAETFAERNMDEPITRKDIGVDLHEYPRSSK